MRVRVAVLCAQVLVAWSASPNTTANENLSEIPVTVPENNNIVFCQGCDTAKEDDPHLAVTLVVDSLNQSRSNSHIEVENLKGPQVSILQYVYRTQQFSDGVIFPGDKRPIVPEAARIAIPEKISTAVTQPSASLDVLMIYRTPSRTFASAYRFFVDHSAKPTERFFSVSWQEERTPFDIEKELQREAISALSKSAGTIFFVLSETRPDGSPNIFNIRTPDRSISFNSITETAQFGSQSNILQTAFDERRAGLHTLIAAWDDSKQAVSLTIDGREISK